MLTLRDPGSTEAQAIVQVVAGATDRLADRRQGRSRRRRRAGERRRRRLPEQRAGLPHAVRSSRPLLASGSAGRRHARVVTASSAHSSELSAPASTQYSLGFTVFFVLMVSLGGAGGILEERELGTLRRLLATPASRSEIVLGQGVRRGADRRVRGDRARGIRRTGLRRAVGQRAARGGDLLGSLVLASTGLGVMLSVLVRTRSQLSAISPIISTALAMIGGCYWPLEITSPFMQKIALATPTGWAMMGLKNTVARGLGIQVVLLPSLVLLTMAAVFFADRALPPAAGVA